MFKINLLRLKDKVIFRKLRVLYLFYNLLIKIKIGFSILFLAKYVPIILEISTIKHYNEYKAIHLQLVSITCSETSLDSLKEYNTIYDKI